MGENMKDIKYLAIVGVIIALLLGVLIFSQAGKKENKKMTGDVNVVIRVKNYGDIELALDSKVAPITVANFVELVEDGFYDGLTFHRIMDGFMIQGGDPLGTGMGGSAKTIKGEFKENGYNNTLSHKKGVISMARSNDPDSASCQFFITDEDATFLDGKYAAFGVVTKGMDIVNKIADDAKPLDDNGLIAREDQPVIEYIKVVK